MTKLAELSIGHVLEIWHTAVRTVVPT